MVISYHAQWFPMNQINHQDRALAYLNRYIYVRQDILFGAPMEITQDGIAAGIGVSRSHVSIILNRLIERGWVDVGFATIKNSKTGKRKIYFLNRAGRNDLKEKMKELDEAGNQVNELVVDLNKCGMTTIRKLAKESLD